VFQTYWHAVYREFHEAPLGIVRNELVFLEVRRGKGSLRRVEPPLGSSASDRAREVASRLRR
jgi:hypothetical protein